jgi:SAM-dependent methyltransferase
MNFKSLRRSYRNWRRKLSRVRPGVFPEPFHHAPDIRAVHDFFASHEPEAECIPDSSETVPGMCYVCNRTVDFLVVRPADGGPVNWRETLSCPHCGLINRWRGCIHLFEALCEPTDRDRLYLTEMLSPVYRTLGVRYPALIGSEYVARAEPGEIIELHGRQVRSEDVTRLSFADRSLEAVLCFDVLEHVPDYRRALSEFYRVLSAGGQLVLSVPFSFQQQTVVRAVEDGMGGIAYLVPACYHGDPLSSEGVLSYYDFGMGLLQEMERVGFSECFVVCHRSAHWGYPNRNITFVARRFR